MVTVNANDGENDASRHVTVTVTGVDEAVDSDPLVAKYDANKNGKIERREVFVAIEDYLDKGAPTRADVFKLIDLYLGD